MMNSSKKLVFKSFDSYDIKERGRVFLCDGIEADIKLGSDVMIISDGVLYETQIQCPGVQGRPLFHQLSS